MAEIKVTAETLSWIIDSIVPFGGQPASQEKIPAKVIPSPNTMINMDPIFEVKLFATTTKIENPNRQNKIPDGINPILFIRFSVEEFVAPNSLMKLWNGSYSVLKKPHNSETQVKRIEPTIPLNVKYFKAFNFIAFDYYF